jgi:tRNA threonylcarbamoyladenosine modification (KEOPS) complex Cgi121 subunit
LILDLSQDGKYAMVSAFRPRAGVDLASLLGDVRMALPRVELQFFENGRVAGADHLRFAAINALHAFKNEINISRSLAMETLLYASAQRQIDVALERLGVTSSSETVGLVAFVDKKADTVALANDLPRLLSTVLDDSLLNDLPDDKAHTIMKVYGVDTVELEAVRASGQAEKEALKKAIAERIALLSTKI